MWVAGAQPGVAVGDGVTQLLRDGAARAAADDRRGQGAHGAA